MPAGAAPSTYKGVDLEHYDFKSKAIAEIAPEDFQFAASLGARGAGSRRVFSQNLSAAPKGVTLDKEPFWNHVGEQFDFVFADVGAFPNANHIDDVNKLTDWLSHSLSPAGVCFAVLKTGIVQTDWDVYNSVLMTPIGRLPSSPYLYDVLLRDFAVRPLVRLKEPAHARYSVSRVFRLGRRQQTLMLILGHSQSGKTTLARELRLNAPHSHLSSDYIFYNLYQNRSSKSLPGSGQGLAQLLGSGSGESAGNFFRSIEDNRKFLEEYLGLAHSLLPRHSNIVSMDIDFRDSKSIEFAKKYFAALGYSVWVVMR